MSLTRENFFVMTGGPGGGKSTVKKELQGMGYCIDRSAHNTGTAQGRIIA